MTAQGEWTRGEVARGGGLWRGVSCQGKLSTRQFAFRYLVVLVSVASLFHMVHPGSSSIIYIYCIFMAINRISFHSNMIDKYELYPFFNMKILPHLVMEFLFYGIFSSVSVITSLLYLFDELWKYAFYFMKYNYKNNIMI